jgi:hypothetical protein
VIVAADLLSQIIVNMLERIFKLICLTIAIFYFGSGPIRVLLYTQPERGMLKYSAGVVELRKKYRGAEYVTLRERSGAGYMFMVMKIFRPSGWRANREKIIA